MSLENGILDKFLAGDDDAYAVIYRTYAKDLYSYGKGLGFDNDILKDAIQDLFLKILCKRKVLSQVTNLKYYLFRALKNSLLNLARHNDHSHGASIPEAVFPISVTILDQLIEDEERVSLEKKILDLLSCLTPRQKEAVYLRFINEMSYEEVAGLLNMTPASAKNLISRAIDRMRKENVLSVFMSLILSLV